MRKTLLSMIAFALVSLGASAQTFVPFSGETKAHSQNVQKKNILKSTLKAANELATNQRALGCYTGDNPIPEEEGGAGLPIVTDPNCKAAIQLTPDEFAPYKGKKIVGIRYSLATKLTGGSRAFITPVVNNQISTTDLVSIDVPNPQVGWNYVNLSEPITITGNENYIIGYDYYQLSTISGGNYIEECYPLAFATITSNPSGSSMLLYANVPANKGGNGSGWYSLSDDGTETFCIQLIVEGEFADYDVTPTSIENVTTMPNVAVSAAIELLNASKEEVSSIDYIVSIDGVATAEQHKELSTPIARGSNGTIDITIPATAEEGTHKITVEITKVNGNANEADTKSLEGTFGVSSTKFPLNVLLEEFTTEPCPNCPRVATLINNVMSSLSEADAKRVTTVCHHYGYSTDWLTGKWDSDIAGILYGGRGLYAPAVTFNRNSSVLSSSALEKWGCVFLPQSANELTAYINGIKQMTTDAQLTITATPDADGTNALVTVSGVCGDGLDKANSFLTFYATEDNVKAHSQQGASGTFYHNHVIRYNNSSWGESITWNDNKFTKTFNVPLNSAWDKNNLSFVAIINGHDATNYVNNKVVNSISTKYEAGATAIDGVSTNNNTTVVARYSANGTLLSAPTKGLNILKLSDGTTVKVNVK